MEIFLAVQHERAPRTSSIPSSLHHYPIGLTRFRPLQFSPLAPNFPLDSPLSTFNGHYLPMYSGLLGSRFFRPNDSLQSVLSEYQLLHFHVCIQRNFQNQNCDRYCIITLSN